MSAATREDYGFTKNALRRTTWSAADSAKSYGTNPVLPGPLYDPSPTLASIKQRQTPACGALHVCWLRFSPNCSSAKVLAAVIPARSAQRKSLRLDWPRVSTMLAAYGYESLTGMHTLHVGCGNGLELDELIDQSRPDRVTCVDLSNAMLERAKEFHPTIETIMADANDLSEVANASIHVYLSFRTYMSRFFDASGALREAYRTLKPGGLCLLSIANGYLDVDAAGNQYLVPGLKDVNGSELVSPDRPFEILGRYHRMIRCLGFERIVVMSKLNEARRHTLPLHAHRSDVYSFASRRIERECGLWNIQLRPPVH